MKTSDTSKDFEIIIEEEHISEIISSLDKKVPEYYEKITNSQLSNGGNFPKSESLIWNQLFNTAIENYNKDSLAYRKLFSEESMDEFEQMYDAKPFKTELKKDCPIIRKSLMSTLEEMQLWKEDFAHAKPQELLNTFANFLDFIRDYSEKTEEHFYDQFKNFEDFTNIATLSEDPDLSLQSVIGAGIKTSVLYNIDPQYFCKSVRRTLYGLYFLTAELHESMPSKTSEFVMIDDSNKNVSKRNSTFNFRIEHNYWYPYNLFMFYSKYIFDYLVILLNEISFDKSKRYVYVNAFLELVCQEHQEAIKTMMGGDQDL
jgi:hypothetical protein